MIEECRRIRAEMTILGWSYLGGGPYPDSPKMNFKRGNKAMVISVVSQEIDAPIQAEQDHGA